MLMQSYIETWESAKEHHRDSVLVTVTMDRKTSPFTSFDASEY